ncbi:hypothetical protein KY290_017243 [Solanum tuberosum]|uniref:Uncharacterized protein n=1 Tax=Solanum tuberosum TaxID=4113 RepID=A0ABQ7VDN7_SOLTU|nr:hypothetical protein KY290_017243 [Solanum tuberosum]
MGDQTPTFLPQSIIVHQDNSAFPMSIVLDETHFTHGSQLMEIHTDARNKIGFLIGEKVKPITIDPSYVTWITDNNREIDHRIVAREEAIARFIHTHSIMPRL